MTVHYTLPQLGWRHFFQQQLSLEEWETSTPARVIGCERTRVRVLTENDELQLPVTHSMPEITVGDWVLLNQSNAFHRLLDRSLLFSRKAAGTKVQTQLLSSNIDTVFIVSSLNLDFNLNRIERYLALANEANVEPVIVLTKVDLCQHPNEHIAKVRTINPFLEIVTVNALDDDSANQLQDWCSEGKTIALLGSSGVGKSTLVNTLSGAEKQNTATIREEDAKGRHTTSSRSLHLLTNGGLLIDTPGMRELQLANCEHGVEVTFPEMTTLSKECKFTDCTHSGEPGCAIRAAIDSGTLDERRLLSYQKLMKEQAFNTATLAEKRANDREFGRFVRSVKKSKQEKKY